MRIEDEVKLDYSDVLIKPKRSTLESRKNVHLKRTYNFCHSKTQFTGIPILNANMDTVGTFDMARELLRHDAPATLHKHYSSEELMKFFKENRAETIFYPMGIVERDFAKLKDVVNYVPVDFICMDVANGYSEKFVESVKRLRYDFPDAVIMAGNVVTGAMTEELILAGADIVKVGIGSGSVCTTRKVTGVGYPQLSAIIECADAAHGLNGHICADGGCTTSGDVAKAFGAGADFVMLGGMLAGHRECQTQEQTPSRTQQYPPSTQLYYGMSSEEAMNIHSGGVAPYRASEGKVVEVPYRGEVHKTIQAILGGLRSTCTYVGASSLKELSKRTTFVRVNRTHNTIFGE